MKIRRDIALTVKKKIRYAAALCHRNCKTRAKLNVAEARKGNLEPKAIPNNISTHCAVRNGKGQGAQERRGARTERSQIDTSI